MSLKPRSNPEGVQGTLAGVVSSEDVVPLARIVSMDVDLHGRVINCRNRDEVGPLFSYALRLEKISDEVNYGRVCLDMRYHERASAAVLIARRLKGEPVGFYDVFGVPVRHAPLVEWDGHPAWTEGNATVVPQTGTEGCLYIRD